MAKFLFIPSWTRSTFRKFCLETFNNVKRIQRIPGYTWSAGTIFSFLRVSFKSLCNESNRFGGRISKSEIKLNYCCKCDSCTIKAFTQWCHIANCINSGNVCLCMCANDHCDCMAILHELRTTADRDIQNSFRIHLVCLTQGHC